MGEVLKRFPKPQFLELIRSGKTDAEAIKVINEGFPEKYHFNRAVLVQAMVNSVDFREAVEIAKKDRADVWFEKIIESQNKEDIFKEDVPAEKLKFEQRKYLAAIDNPDKYAEKTKHSLDLNLNIFQEMKDMPLVEARKILASADPFTIEVESVVVEETEEDIFS